MAAYTPQPQPDPNAKSGYATAGFVCGLVGVFLGWILWPLPILGIVFGAIGWRHKLGKAGVILGVVSIVSGILIFLAVFASTGTTTTTNSFPAAPVVTAPAAPSMPTYLTMVQSSNTLEGVYTDEQLTTYGEQACQDGASTNVITAAEQLETDTGIPAYDAGYIAGAAAALLCPS
jgi:hypothetical protein